MQQQFSIPGQRLFSGAEVQVCHQQRVRRDRLQEQCFESKRYVVAVLPADQRKRISQTTLSRRCFNVVHFDNQLQAIKTLVSRTPELLLVYDSGFGVDALSLITRSFQEIPFSIVVLSEFSGQRYPPIVKEVIPADFDLEDFNQRIGKILSLPTRTSQRFLVRIVCEVSTSGRCWTPVLANTVDLSESGIMVQCHRPLDIGTVYSIQFLGFEHLELPVYSIKIVHIEPSRIRGARPDRYGGIFIGESAEKMREIFGELVP